MTLATFNQCVDHATGVSKTAHLPVRLGARHAGRSEGFIEALTKIRFKRGKHRKK